LHSGNILIDDDEAKLSNYENFFFGYAPRPQIEALTSHLENFLDMEVILFGHVLYEMTFGMELNAARVDSNGVPHYRGLHIMDENVSLYRGAHWLLFSI